MAGIRCDPAKRIFEGFLDDVDAKLLSAIKFQGVKLRDASDECLRRRQG